MFGSAADLGLARADSDGNYRIECDVSVDMFRAILGYYVTGKVDCPPTEPVASVRAACDFFLIPFSVDTVVCYNTCELLQELSQQGARESFIRYLCELLLPAMSRSAQEGERECHIVVLLTTDVLDWEEACLPGYGEEHARIVRSTPLYRFLRYDENRSIAKEVLEGRGLKRVRVGVEGFPMTKQKVKKWTHTGRPVVEYNYEQRPFMHCSWEADEHRSRHVDFQCVRPRGHSQTNLLRTLAEIPPDRVQAAMSDVLTTLDQLPPNA